MSLRILTAAAAGSLANGTARGMIEGLLGAPARSYSAIYGNVFIVGAVLVACSVAAAIAYAIKRRSPVARVLPLW
jgi:hypothetical protein